MLSTWCQVSYTNFVRKCKQRLYINTNDTTAIIFTDRYTGARYAVLLACKTQDRSKSRDAVCPELGDGITAPTQRAGDLNAYTRKAQGASSSTSTYMSITAAAAVAASKLYVRTTAAVIRKLGSVGENHNR